MSAQSQVDLAGRSPAAPAQRPTGPAAVPPRVVITPPPRPPASGTAAPRDRALATLDVLLRSGAPAARALLEHLDRSGEGKPTITLSSNARAGLEWIIHAKGSLPENLRNALIHLLTSMEAYQLGPAEVMARSSATPGPAATRPDLLPRLPEPFAQQFTVLFQHADRMESFLLSRPALSRDVVLRAALVKLKSKKLDISAADIDRLHKLYEEMRRDNAR